MECIISLTNGRLHFPCIKLLKSAEDEEAFGEFCQLMDLNGTHVNVNSSVMVMSLSFFSSSELLNNLKQIFL
jgi:hypothetical protein